MLGCIASGQTVHVAGQVADSAGAPVARATVLLFGADAYTQTTGKSGEFALDVAPGVYAIVAAHSGFVFQKQGARDPLASSCRLIAVLRVMAERGNVLPQVLNDQKECVRQAPGMMLALDAGKDIKDLKITLTPVSTVSGTVTDETGDPIASWEVRLWRIGYGRDEHRTLVGSSAAQSNGDGAFRIANVSPGRYYLSAGIPPQDDGRMRASRPPRVDLVKTFYPSELDFSRSAVVNVTPGVELRGMDIRVRKTQLYSISGSVIPGPGAGDAVGQDLRLFGEDALGNLVQRSTARVRASDNSWQFRGVAPGEYVLLGGGGDGAIDPQHCIRRRVSVADSDLKGLVFPLGDCPQLTGTIKFEDAPTEVPPSVTLTDSLTGFSRNSESNPDGSFRTVPLAQSEYFIDVPGLPANAYVKSARSGGQDVVRSPLDITDGSPGHRLRLWFPFGAQR